MKITEIALHKSSQPAQFNTAFILKKKLDDISIKKAPDGAFLA